MMMATNNMTKEQKNNVINYVIKLRRDAHNSRMYQSVHVITHRPQILIYIVGKHVLLSEHDRIICPPFLRHELSIHFWLYTVT